MVRRLGFVALTILLFLVCGVVAPRDAEAQRRPTRLPGSTPPVQEKKKMTKLQECQQKCGDNVDFDKLKKCNDQGGKCMLSCPACRGEKCTCPKACNAAFTSCMGPKLSTVKTCIAACKVQASKG